MPTSIKPIDTENIQTVEIALFDDRATEEDFKDLDKKDLVNTILILTELNSNLVNHAKELLADYKKLDRRHNIMWFSYIAVFMFFFWTGWAKL